MENKKYNRGAKRKDGLPEFVRLGMSIKSVVLEKYGRDKLLNELHGLMRERLKKIEKEIVG